jgi:hypothetical protein
MSSVAKNIEDWRRQGLELRKQLLRERQDLMQKLFTIDQHLSQLPSDDDDDGVGSAQVPPGSFTAVQAVAHILKSSQGTELNARQVHQAVQLVKPGMSARKVQTILYRLAERGHVARKGERGNMVFIWVGGSP